MHNTTTHKNQAEAIEHARRAVLQAGYKKKAVVITFIPCADGDWLVEVASYRDWARLRESARDALLTWEKASLRTLGLVATMMDKLRAALADVDD